MTTPEHDHSAAPGVSTGSTSGAASAGGAANANIAARLRTIEQQPLPESAESYEQVHDEMRARLEGGDAAGMQD